MGVHSLGATPSLSPPLDAAATADVPRQDPPWPPSATPQRRASGFDDTSGAVMALHLEQQPPTALANPAKSLGNDGLIGAGLARGSNRDELGAGPGPRPSAADFAGQAQASGAGDQKEAKAIALGKAALEKDFGVCVIDGDRAWTAEALSRAYESLSVVPVADREHLEGLELVRERAAPAAEQVEARFGNTTGFYQPNVQAKDGARLQNASITLYDTAFPPGDAERSRKVSMQVFLHEAGHVVDGRLRDEAMAALNLSVEVVNQKVKDFNQTAGPCNEAGRLWNGAIDGLNQALRRGSSELRGFARATGAVGQALAALQRATTPEALAGAQAALAAAEERRDAASATLSGDERGLGDAFKEAGASLAPAALARGQANVAWHAATKDEQAKRRALAALATAPSFQNSSELQAFTRARGPEHAVSDYGTSRGSEGYAEAYGVYQRDPAFMKAHFPRQYAFFRANHRSPHDP